MMYLLTAIGYHPVAVVQYTFTHTNIRTDTKQTIHKTTQKMMEECWPCPAFACFVEDK